MIERGGVTGRVESSRGEAKRLEYCKDYVGESSNLLRPRTRTCLAFHFVLYNDVALSAAWVGQSARGGYGKGE